MAENASASAPVKGPRVSEGQRETVLAFMEQNLQLALRSSELGPGFIPVDRRRLWQQLADALNAEGPVVKTVDQWQQVYEACHDATAIAKGQRSTGGGRAPGFRGRVLQLTGTVRFRGVTDLPYQERPVRPPRGQRPRRVDTLTTMSSQCARSLEQGDERLQVGR
ncbi:hypothetical protein HPB49_008941 [Dermacentor silvarum]|uniref:Uncharacterized protein n=1 Tax=Dermacentor silvarum TaxID=543639 RepID=A0ACB8CQL1_DERSI|nr:hypothetical protein HPB49_008941 [Dermacentor silvarum]